MSDLRDQQQQAANQNTADAEAISNALKNVHTFVPGIIHSFDPATQTAQVQPAIKRIFVEQGAVNLPLCVDVPVHFLKCGQFCITAPVTPGDECLLGFFERAIDKWYAAGGVQEPSEYRLHHLSDGFAIVGISSMPSVITGFNPTDIEIRTLDGNAKIQITPAGVITQQTGAASTILDPAGTFVINAPAGFVVNAAGGYTLNSAAGGTANGPLVNSADITAGGKSLMNHTHKENDVGGQTDPPT